MVQNVKQEIKAGLFKTSFKELTLFTSGAQPGFSRGGVLQDSAMGEGSKRRGGPLPFGENIEYLIPQMRNGAIYDLKLTFFSWLWLWGVFEQPPWVHACFTCFANTDGFIGAAFVGTV